IELFEGLAPLLASPEKAKRKALTLLSRAYPGQTPDEALADVQAHAGSVPGEVVFLLHDTYGFPSDLTAVMARERGLGVDEARFEALMGEQRTRARAAAGFAVDYNETEAAWTADGEGDGAEPGTQPTEFVGYDALAVDDARIVRSRTRGEGDSARHEIVLDRTPFYAESGGQVGDTGTLSVGGETVRVLDTVKGDGGQTVHVVDRMPADRSGTVTATVDAARRRRIMRHHTATHLLQAALREGLGESVQQRGSRVEPDRLRFDFASPERVSPEQQRAVEARVNAFVLANTPLGDERAVPIAEAKARGAMALFGEKYGESVRVVTFDPAGATDAAGVPLPVSVELCGGTHVPATGEIGLFRIVSEGSVSSGVRRVEAVAGEAALAWLAGQMAELDAARGLFKQLPDGLAGAVAAVQDEARTLAKEVAAARSLQAAAGLDATLAAATDVDGLRLVVARLDGTGADTLRDLAEQARTRLGDVPGVAVFAAVDGGKVALAASATDAAVALGVQAGKLIGALAKRVGGGGGGRPTLATAGGKDPEALDAALSAVADDVRALRG
ncbi:MAG TPA: alanine--tRNA ligase-related protein, partial [Rubricoccaceae bacterium]